MRRLIFSLVALVLVVAAGQRARNTPADVGESQLWDPPVNVTGAGVRIAVLDTGDFFIDGSGRSAIDVHKVTLPPPPR